MQQTRKDKMQNIQSKKIQVNKVDINYFSGGTDDPLVVIHGGGEGARSWLKNAEELSKNYSVYIPDLPGFGDSQQISDRFHMPEYVSFVDDFTRTLGLERFYLVGHSIGGGIALHYAFKHPHKVSGLVLVDSFCLGKEVALWIRVLSASALCRSLGQFLAACTKAIKSLVHLVYAPFSFANPLSYIKIDMGPTMTTLRGQRKVLKDRLPNLEVPTLVVWGAKDIIVPASQAYAAARVIPDCQLHVFHDCGHSAYKQRPTEFSQVVARFLRLNRQIR